MGTVVGAEDRSCTPEMGTLGCQVLGPGLSILLGYGARLSPKFWGRVFGVTTPTQMTRGEAVHNSL